MIPLTCMVSVKMAGPLAVKFPDKVRLADEISSTFALLHCRLSSIPFFWSFLILVYLFITSSFAIILLFCVIVILIWWEDTNIRTEYSSANDRQWTISGNIAPQQSHVTSIYGPIYKRWRGSPIGHYELAGTLFHGKCSTCHSQTLISHRNIVTMILSKSHNY